MVSHSRAGVPALTGRLPVPSRRRAVHPGGSGGPRRHGSRPQRDSRPGLPPTGARRRVVGPLAGRHPEPGRPASVRTGIRAVRDRRPPALTPGLHTAPLCIREHQWGGACAPPRSTASACFPPGLPAARARPAYLVIILMRMRTAISAQACRHRRASGMTVCLPSTPAP